MMSVYTADDLKKKRQHNELNNLHKTVFTFKKLQKYWVEYTNTKTLDTPLYVKCFAQLSLAVLSKVDDFATFKKVEVHAWNSTF